MRTVLTLLFFLLAACRPGLADNPPAPGGPDSIAFSGTVQYLPFEGGFYGLVAADGQRYDPVNLPEEFQKDGLAVKVTARLRPNLASFHMWGTIVEILHIEKR